MAPRKYEQRLRAESREETRQRILAASMALHSEKGFAATSFKDIAARADVSVGTVYYHFPTIDQLVPACGAFAAEQIKPPAADIYDGLTSTEDRVGAFVRAVFDHYKAMGPAIRHAYHERHQFPVVNDIVTETERHMRTLFKSALTRKLPSSVSKRAEALFDHRVWESFRSRGLSQDVIASTITASILAIIREARP